MPETTTTPTTEIVVSFKVADNAPLDFRGRFYRMAEAMQHAYEGMPCYVMETGKFYIFLRNAEGQLYANDSFPDLTLYALKANVTAEIAAAVAALINQSPEMLNTLNELSKALNDDPNFSTTMTNLLSQKVDKETGKSLMTDEERAKLANVEAGAINMDKGTVNILTLSNLDDIKTTGCYHIIQYADGITDPTDPAFHRLDWGVLIVMATGGAIAQTWFFSAIKGRKFDGSTWSEWKALNYTHPETHPALMIEETRNRRFMTDIERAKLAAIEAEANKYAHPTTHAASMITEETDKRFMTDAERTKLGNLSETPETYQHPASHPASIITEEPNKRFMTDAERTKLASVQAGATNYQHPATHAASMIVVDANNRFVSDTEKSKWNNMFSRMPLGTINVSDETNLDAYFTPGLFSLIDDSYTPAKANYYNGFLIINKNDNYTSQIWIKSAGILFRNRIEFEEVAGVYKDTDWSSWIDLTAKTPLSTTTPAALGTAAAGTSTAAARADHVHALPEEATDSKYGLMSAFDKKMIERTKSTLTLSLTAHKALSASEVLENGFINIDGTSTSTGYNLVLPSKSAMDALLAYSIGMRLIVRKRVANGNLCAVTGFDTASAPAIRMGVSSAVEFIMSATGWAVLSIKGGVESSSAF